MIRDINGNILIFSCFFFRTIKGDEFALRDGGSLYCKEDHDVLEKSAQSRVALPIESNNNTNLSNNNHSSELGSMSGESMMIKMNYIFVQVFRHECVHFRCQLVEHFVNVNLFLL